MKRKLIGVLVVGVVLFGFLYWWFTPAQMVKRRTGKLMQMVSFEKGQGKAARQTGVYALHALLAPDVELSSTSHDQANGVFQREQLESVFNWLAGQVVESTFEIIRFDGIRINEKFAEVDVLVRAEMVLPQSKPVDGTYSVFLVWEDHETGWQLAHAKWGAEGSAR